MKYIAIFILFVISLSCKEKVFEPTNENFYGQYITYIPEKEKYLIVLLQEVDRSDNKVKVSVGYSNSTSEKDASFEVFEPVNLSGSKFHVEKSFEGWFSYSSVYVLLTGTFTLDGEVKSDQKLYMETKNTPNPGQSGLEDLPNDMSAFKLNKFILNRVENGIY